MSKNTDTPPRVAVLTENRFLYQKIKLELGDMAECFMPEAGTVPSASLYLVDLDSKSFKGAVGLTMSYTDEGADVKLPFAIGSLRGLVFGKGTAAISIDSERKQVQIGGRVISLTDVELALFTAIYKRGGEYASRDTLLQEVCDILFAVKHHVGAVAVYLNFCGGVSAVKREEARADAVIRICAFQR